MPEFLGACMRVGAGNTSAEPRDIQVLGARRVAFGIAASQWIAAALAFAPSLCAESGWVAETPHFRVLAHEAPGIDATTIGLAATVLERIRQQFHLVGAGLPERADGPLEVLVVPNKLELHELLREPPGSKTRGITVGGLDRDYVAVPWHEIPGPQVTLAHEYAHQLDRSDWPLWFREGRAVYLARRTPPLSGQDSRVPLVEMMDRATWLDWDALLQARADSVIASNKLFQAQAWLLVQWLAAQGTPLARLAPGHGSAALAELGSERLSTVLRDHLATLHRGGLEELAGLPPTPIEAKTRAAADWELPLLRAEIQRELRFLDAAEQQLRSITERFPKAARAQAGHASMALIRGNLDAAERFFRTAIELGDRRARTSYRYALLMMRPGGESRIRAEAALSAAMRARRADPSEAVHQLAVAHAHMLLEDWNGAFAELRKLARFRGWSARADKEAAEVVRRRLQSIGGAQAPLFGTERRPFPTLLAGMAGAGGKPDPFKPRDSTPNPPAPPTWAPHGAWIAHGRIAWVDCSTSAKTVILHSSFKRYVLRENPNSPPLLVNRPFRAKAIPCNTRGYVVRIAYRKLSERDGPHGEIVGIHF